MMMMAITRSVKGEVYIISLPLYITTGIRKKTKYAVNLNEYKKMYYQKAATFKRVYMEQVGNQEDFKALPLFRKVSLSYKVHFGSKTSYDVDNIVSVSSKFFQDTLVTRDKIEDDNHLLVPEFHGYGGDMDRKNPRVDVYIEELE